MIFSQHVTPESGEMRKHACENVIKHWLPKRVPCLREKLLCYLECVFVSAWVCVTFLSDRAPDGDNEDADDGENQQCQNATYHCIWYCTVSLHHCTRIWERTNKTNSVCGWSVGYIKGNMEIKVERSAAKVGGKKDRKVREWKHINTPEWERVQGARQEKREVDIFHPTCIITFHHPPLHRTPQTVRMGEKKVEKWGERIKI